VDLTIIMPTYNEQDNVRIITAKIQQVMRHEPYTYELLFVDDSTDNTPQVLAQLCRKYPNIRFLHRTKERGLASAVVQGFKAARGQHIIVMDADLQHPPELIPLMVRRLAAADIVVPSRFIPGGSDGGLNCLRKLISWTARTIGRVAISKLRHISDCTSGYFGVNRSVIDGVPLAPIGWKILMEVLVKGRYQRVHEIPYVFTARASGASKMSLGEQRNYLRHIIALVASSPEDRRFFCFCLVGLSGVFVNLLCLKLLITFGNISTITASVGACLLAMVSNFIWNDSLTWRERKLHGLSQRVWRFPQFLLISLVGIGITASIAELFLSLNMNIYLAQLTGIIAATGWSFSANNRWTWATPSQAAAPDYTVTQETERLQQSRGL
jgi:dolichol-phosphate mannosyltransferase